jgi:hypothetical protein
VNVLSWAALAYLVIGLALAALIYHGMNGGLDDAFDDRPCQDCGQPHRLSDEARDTVEMLDRIRTLRATDHGRLAIAIVTAITCLMVTLAWPAVIVWLATKHAREQQQ